MKRREFITFSAVRRRRGRSRPRAAAGEALIGVSKAE